MYCDSRGSHHCCECQPVVGVPWVGVPWVGTLSDVQDEKPT